MAWITPKINWIAGDGIGFSDMNRIEGDIKHVYETGVVPVGTWSIGSLATFSSSAANILPDQDKTINLGRLRIDSRYTDHVVLSHYDLTGLSEFAMTISNIGNVNINAKTGSSVTISNNVSAIAQFTSASVNVLKDFNPQYSFIASTVTQGELYSAVAAWVGINDILHCSGQFKSNVNGFAYIIGLKRVTTTDLEILGITTNGTIFTEQFVAGNSTTMGEIQIKSIHIAT